MSVAKVYEGRRFSPVFWAAVQEWRTLCRAEGVPFTITQGGFNAGKVGASASTHDGDAIDVSARNMTEKQASRLVYLGRKVGIAVWFRTTSVAKWGTRAHGFGSYHFHGVPNGWGYPSTSARNQANSYRRGLDGLQRNLADTGPGHTGEFRNQTWGSYLSSKPKPKPSGDGKMSEEMVRRVVREEINRFYSLPRTAGGASKPFIQHILDDIVMGHARSVAHGTLRNQLRAVADKLGVKIDESAEATAYLIQEQMDDSIHRAIAEHYPSMERAEVDEIAQTFFDLLAESLHSNKG